MALAAVVGLRSWLYVDHRETGAEREATTAAMAWVDAYNAHDLQAVEASMSSTGRVVFLSEDGVQDGPLSGANLTAFTTEMFNDGTRSRTANSARRRSQPEHLAGRHRGVDALSLRERVAMR